MRFVRTYVDVFLSLLLVPPAFAQQDYTAKIASPDFAMNEPVEFGAINLANGNLHLEFPFGSGTQRGNLRFAAKLVYDSRIWTVGYHPPSSTAYWEIDPTLAARGVQGGWWVSVTGLSDGASASFVDRSCTDGFGTFHNSYAYGPFNWRDFEGTYHTFQIQTDYDDPTYPCYDGDITSTGAAWADDGSGYYMIVTGYYNATVYTKSGIQISPTPTDTNGNYFSKDPSGNVVDTLGRTIMLKTVNGNSTYYDILNSQGSRSRYTITTTTINISSNFGAPNSAEYSGTLTVISSLTLPDGTAYTFGYDSGTAPGNYGLLRTITLPTGGQISYAYTNFVAPCANPPMNRWVFSRTSGSGTWTYSPLELNSQCNTSPVNASEQITVTKPSGDNVVHTFTFFSTLGSPIPWDTRIDYYNQAVQSSNLVMTETRDYVCSPTIHNGQILWTPACSTQMRALLTSTYVLRR